MKLMFRTLTDDQQEILESLEAGHYQLERTQSDNISFYITNSGIAFKWLHGFGDGKSIKIFDDKQPEWFAKKVRNLLNA